MKTLSQHQIQNRFFEIITGDEEITDPRNNRIGVYRDLVFHRFYEVLKNVYPFFKEQIGDDVFRSMIRLYIQNKPKSRYIWKMPDDFRNFCFASKEAASVVSNFPFAADLLLYEWTEVELLMKDYTSFLKTGTLPFSWEHSFVLSESSLLMTPSYRVYAGEFKTPGDFYVILYYNFQEHKIYFQEITLFMNDLIFSMGRKKAGEALAGIADRYNLDLNETRGILFDTLNDYCDKKILVRV